MTPMMHANTTRTLLLILLPIFTLAACSDQENAAPQMEGGKQVVEITVGTEAFSPARIELEAGVPARLLFTRISESTCATKIKAPALGIEETELPLNEPVAVEFIPTEEGDYTFVCGMDMVEGSIIVES